MKNYCPKCGRNLLYGKCKCGYYNKKLHDKEVERDYAKVSLPVFGKATKVKPKLGV